MFHAAQSSSGSRRGSRLAAGASEVLLHRAALEQSLRAAGGIGAIAGRMRARAERWSGVAGTARPEIVLVSVALIVIGVIAWVDYVRRGGFYADDWSFAAGYQFPTPGAGRFGHGGSIADPGRPL